MSMASGALVLLNRTLENFARRWQTLRHLSQVAESPPRSCTSLDSRMPDASACTAACRGEAMPRAVAVLRGLVAFQDRRLHHCSEEEMDKASRSAACGVHMHCHLHTWRKPCFQRHVNMHQRHRVEEHLPLLRTGLRFLQGFMRLFAEASCMQSTATGDVDGGIGGSEILPLAGLWVD